MTVYSQKQMAEQDREWTWRDEVKFFLRFFTDVPDTTAKKKEKKVWWNGKAWI